MVSDSGLGVRVVAQLSSYSPCTYRQATMQTRCTFPSLSIQSRCPETALPAQLHRPARRTRSDGISATTDTDTRGSTGAAD